MKAFIYLLLTLCFDTGYAATYNQAASLAVAQHPVEMSYADGCRLQEGTIRRDRSYLFSHRLQPGFYGDVSQVRDESQETTALAVIACACGLLGFFVAGWLFGPAAAAIGIVALKRNPKKQGIRLFATLGVVFGIAAMLSGIAILLDSIRFF